MDNRLDENIKKDKKESHELQMSQNNKFGHNTPALFYKILNIVCYEGPE